MRNLSFSLLIIAFLCYNCGGNEAQKQEEVSQKTPQTTNTQTPKSEEAPTTSALSFEDYFAKNFVGKSKTGILNGITNAIHPELGVYLSYRPGVSPIIGKYDNVEQLQESVSNLGDVMQDINCSLEKSTFPEIDESGEFEKTGCFYQDLENQGQISATYQEISEVQLLSFEESELAEAKKADEQVSRMTLLTDAGVSLGFGEIEGKWYLLYIDLASYDLGA